MCYQYLDTSYRHFFSRCPFGRFKRYFWSVVDLVGSSDAACDLFTIKMWFTRRSGDNHFIADFLPNAGVTWNAFS